MANLVKLFNGIAKQGVVKNFSRTEASFKMPIKELLNKQHMKQELSSYGRKLIDEYIASTPNAVRQINPELIQGFVKNLSKTKNAVKSTAELLNKQNIRQELSSYGRKLVDEYIVSTPNTVKQANPELIRRIQSLNFPKIDFMEVIKKFKK